ncbi:MAG: hypothetical protein H6739_28670 [Alphaproteobacteria bacterium]|nr:hypothetical protein [Alphaproteobacteria bacterium]
MAGKATLQKQETIQDADLGPQSQDQGVAFLDQGMDPVQRAAMYGNGAAGDALAKRQGKSGAAVGEGSDEGVETQSSPTEDGGGITTDDGDSGSSGLNAGGEPGKPLSVNVHTVSMSSISWIPESAGLPVHDEQPASQYQSGLVTPSEYRFCNRFTVTLRVEEFADRYDLYATIAEQSLMGTTHGVPALKYNTGLSLSAVAVGTHGGGFAAQSIVGARTALPNPGGFNPFSDEKIKFPPIWTQLNLTLYQDGHVEQERASAWSHFPQHYVYDHNGSLISQNTPDYAEWHRSGWGNGRRTPGRSGPSDHTGNPWDSHQWGSSWLNTGDPHTI